MGGRSKPKRDSIPWTEAKVYDGIRSVVYAALADGTEGDELAAALILHASNAGRALDLTREQFLMMCGQGYDLACKALTAFGGKAADGSKQGGKTMLRMANGGVLPASRLELVRLMTQKRIYPEGPWPMTNEAIAATSVLLFGPVALEDGYSGKECTSPAEVIAIEEAEIARLRAEVEAES
jgi:hypothetical protein